MKTNRSYKALGFMGFLKNRVGLQGKKRLETLGNKRHFCLVSQEEQTAAFSTFLPLTFWGLQLSSTEQESHKASTKTSASSSLRCILHAEETLIASSLKEHHSQVCDCHRQTAVKFPMIFWRWGTLGAEHAATDHKLSPRAKALSSSRTTAVIPWHVYWGDPLIPTGFPPASTQNQALSMAR